MATQDPFSQDAQGNKSGMTFMIIIVLLIGFLLIQSQFGEKEKPKSNETVTADDTDESKKANEDNGSKIKDDNKADTKDGNKTTKTDENNTVKKDDTEQTKPEIEEAKYPWQMQQPQKTLKESYIKSEKYDTDVMEIAFSTRGGTIAEIWLKGFPGGGKNHMDIPENEKNRLQYVRPYNPNKLTGALDFSSEDYELKSGLSINAEWEFVEHKTTNEIISKPSMNDLTQDYKNIDDVEVVTDKNLTTHEITFAYPPKNAKGEVPFRVFKTFKYSDKEYMINIDLRIVNYTNNLLDIDEFVLWGPVGLFTGYGNRISDYAIWKIGATTDATWESTSSLQSSYDKLNKESRQLKNFSTNVLAKSNMTGGRLTFLGSFNGQFEAVMMYPRIFNKDVFVEEGIVEMFQIDGNADPEFPKRVLPAYAFEFNKIRLKKGETLSISTPMFVGPKKEDFIPPALEETMLYSFEWINWLGKIMFKIMKFFHGIVVNMGIGGAWGIAIILLTILVRICLMPLSYKAQSAMQESQANMKKIQPKITKIKQKYGAGKKQLTREQKMKMNQEVMGVWRNEGVGMGGMFKGCLIMILQMPIWIALFGVFRYTTDLYGASFLWISDLTKPDALFMIYDGVPKIPLLGNFLAGTGIFFFNILPFFAIGLMYYQSKLTQAQQPSMDDEQAKKQRTTMGCMYIMFFFLFYSFAAGFNLYFLASSGFGVIEAKYIRSRFMKKRQDAEVEAASAPKKTIKKK